MIPVTTVCNVYDDPAILLKVDPSALLMGVKVKGVESGRILELGGLLRPGIIDGKPYLGLPGFRIGELVACRIDAVDADDLDRWFADDHEVGLRDFMQDKVACLTTPEDLQEPPQDIAVEDLESRVAYVGFQLHLNCSSSLCYRRRPNFDTIMAFHCAKSPATIWRRASRTSHR